MMMMMMMMMCISAYLLHLTVLNSVHTSMMLINYCKIWYQNLCFSSWLQLCSSLLFKSTAAPYVQKTPTVLKLCCFFLMAVSVVSIASSNIISIF
jgi:hypothetical protein